MTGGPWRCPRCKTVIDHADYTRAMKGQAFTCRACGVALVIDRKGDQAIQFHVAQDNDRPGFVTIRW